MVTSIIQDVQQVVRKLLIIIFTLSSIAAVGAVAAAANGVPCADVKVEEGEHPTRGYSYSLIKAECAGTLRLRVHANFADQHVVEAYKANSRSLETRAHAATYGGREIPVTITFARPMNDADLAVFINQTGLRVNSYIVGLRDKQGGKAAFTYWPDDNQVLSSTQLMEKNLVNSGEHTIQGTLVISGKITMTETNLHTIATHEQVSLLDLTALDVLPILEQKYQATAIDVFLPSPYWNQQW